MFICSLCGQQSQPGESPIVMPVTLRIVTYEHEHGPTTQGSEWASSKLQCSACAFTVLAKVVGTKTVLVKEVQRERHSIQD